MMDNFGPCHFVLPSMGKAQCFLGTPWSESFEMVSNSSQLGLGLAGNQTTADMMMMTTYPVDDDTFMPFNATTPDESFVSFFGQIKWKSFFKSSEFLYFHSILITLQVTNVLFFLATVYYLVDQRVVLPGD